MCELTSWSLKDPLSLCRHGQQSSALLKPPLTLAVNDTTRVFVSSLPSSLLHPSLMFSSSLSSLTHLLISSPSAALSLSSPFTVPHVSVFQSLLPLSSPCQMVSVSLGWLQNQSNSFFFFFFYLHHSFSASLPSLILVSSHCGVFNASYHMVADSSWRCRGAFIHALKHSCNNACQASDFFITLMLALADPSNPPTTPTNKPAQLLSPSLNT